MPRSLKLKLLIVTVVSVAAIAILGLYSLSSAGSFATTISQSQIASAALRNHMHADMMHDALRADVFAAHYVLLRDPERKAAVLEQTKKHALAFKQDVADNKALGLPANVKVTLDRLEQPLKDYIAAAEQLVAEIFEDHERAETLLMEFEKQFSTLEAAMQLAAERINALVEEQVSAADGFAVRTKWLSEISFIVGVFIACGLVFVLLRDVLFPISTLSETLDKLTQGNFDVTLPIGRADEIGQMARTIDSFRCDAIERNKLARESRTFSQLNEWLQSAKSEAELYEMIADVLKRLLPDCTGSVYIYANSRDVLECVKAWNGDQVTITMHPDDCWGLRRGRTYTHGESEIEFKCSHVHAGAADDYCCIPILAHGETVGLLHLEYKPREIIDAASHKARFAEQRRLGLAAAEHISLAIANVKLRDQIRDQSIRDSLTGLYNRRYMLETARREFHRAGRSGQTVSLLSIDVDHFKQYNDNHGHDAGDVVLRAVGEALQSSFRDDEVPCRFGGEEFVVVLPGNTASVARKRAEQLRAKIEALSVRYAEGNLPKITISVGIATYPHSGSTPVEVLKVADEALYVAKREGRNRVQVSPGAGTEMELPISADEDVRPRDVVEHPCCRLEPTSALVAAE